MVVVRTAALKVCISQNCYTCIRSKKEINNDINKFYTLFGIQLW